LVVEVEALQVLDQHLCLEIQEVLVAVAEILKVLLLEVQEHQVKEIMEGLELQVLQDLEEALVAAVQVTQVQMVQHQLVAMAEQAHHHHTQVLQQHMLEEEGAAAAELQLVLLGLVEQMEVLQVLLEVVAMEVLFLQQVPPDQTTPAAAEVADFLALVAAKVL
jgi:hypothetical protein